MSSQNRWTPGLKREEHESGLQSLLDQLKEVGQERSQGRFTLDRERSRELLARYRLEQPEAFGLNLVAAAVASGAQQIEILSTPTHFVIGFDGRPFVQEELENVHSSLFLTERTAPVVRLQELAIALQAASSLGFGQVELLSHQAGVATICLTVVGGRHEVERRACTPFSPRSGGEAALSTEVRLVKKQSLSWLKRLFATPNEAPVASIIRSRCSWAPARIRLNGELLATPSLPGEALLVSLTESSYQPDGALQVRPLQGRGLRGVVLYHPPRGVPNHLRLILHGVCYEQPWSIEGWGLVHCDHVRKDLSQTALLRADVEEVIADLQSDYVQHVQLLCQRYVSLSPREQDRARDFLLDCRWVRTATMKALPMSVRDQLHFCIREVPLFPLVGGGQASVEVLRNPVSRPHEKLFFTRRLWQRGCLDGTPVVDAVDPELLSALRAEQKEDDGLRGIVLADGDELLMEAERAEQRRLRFEGQVPSDPVLAGEDYWLRLPLDQTRGGLLLKALGWDGQVGMARGRGAREGATLHFFCGGRFLEQRTLSSLEGWPDGMCVALQHAELRPNIHYTGLADYEVWWERVRGPLRDLAYDLLEQCAVLWRSGTAGRPEELRKAFLTAALRPASGLSVPLECLRDLHIFPLAVVRLAYPDRTAPPVEVSPEPESHDGELVGPAPDPSVPLAQPAVAALSEDERQWNRQYASWQELHEQGQRLGFLPTATASRHWGFAPGTGELVVKCDPWLEGHLGTSTLQQPRNFENELRQAERRAVERDRWMKAPPVEVCLGEVPALLAKVPLHTPEGAKVHISGEMGALAGSNAFYTTRVEFYRSGRPLGSRYVTCTDPAIDLLPPGLAVALDCQEFEPDDAYAGVRDSLDLMLAYNAVRTNLPGLAQALSRKFPSQGSRRQQLQYQFFNCLAAARLGADDPRWESVLCLDYLDGGLGLCCEVAEILRAQGKITVLVEEERPGPLAGLPPAFWFTPRVYEAFAHWIGPDRILDCQDQYLAHLYEQDRQARPTEVARLPEAAEWTEPLRTSLGEGEIGLLADTTIPGFAVRLRVLSRGKHVDEITLKEAGDQHSRPRSISTSWRVAAVLDCPTLGGHLSPDALTIFRQEVLPAVRLVAFEQAAALAEMEESRRESLQDYLWSRLAWEAQAGRGSGSSEGEVDPCGFTVDQDEVRARLRLAPVFPTAAGPWVSLDALLKEVEAGSRILYWMGQPPRLAPTELVLLARRNQVAVLRDILGARHLADATNLIMARLRAEDYERQPLVEKMELAPKDFLITHSVSLPGATGSVGLLRQVGRPSTIQLYWRQRLLETVKLHFDFSIEACLECPELKPNRDWTAVTRSWEFDAILEQLSETVWQLIHQRTPEEYRLELALHMRASRSPQTQALLEAPLLTDPWGQSISLAQLRALFEKQRFLFYWPAEVAPPSPEVVPEGQLLPMLTSPTLKLLNAPPLERWEDFQPRAAAAARLFEYLPQPEPRGEPEPTQLLLELPHGWLISRLDSTERTLTRSWKGRPLPSVRIVGWPGYRAHLRADSFTLTSAATLEDNATLSYLEAAEEALEAAWLARLEGERRRGETASPASPFTPDFWRSVAPLLPRYGRLAEGARRLLPPELLAPPPKPTRGAEQPRDAWQILVERLRGPLQELHGSTEFKLERAAQSGGWTAVREKGRTVYRLNFVEAPWRARLEAMSTPWLVLSLWLCRSEEEARADRNAYEGRSRHRRVMEWLLGQ